MPRYDFECQICGFVEEKVFSISEKPAWVPCARCGQGAKHMIGSLRPPMTIEDFEPYYDENLETFVKSKAHRREVMRRQGLVEKGPLSMARRKEIREKAEYWRHERPKEIGRDNGKPKGTIFSFAR